MSDEKYLTLKDVKRLSIGNKVKITCIKSEDNDIEIITGIENDQLITECKGTSGSVISLMSADWNGNVCTDEISYLKFRVSKVNV